jgi:hypothetical protein
MTVTSPTSPLHLGNTSSSDGFPTPGEQFTLLRLSGGTQPIIPDEVVILKSVLTGQHCRLVPLPLEPSLTGVMCDQTTLVNATRLVYKGIGFTLVNGTWLTPTGPSCTFVVNANATTEGIKDEGGGGGSNCTTSCTGGPITPKLLLMPPPSPAPPPAGPPLPPGTPMELRGSCGDNPNARLITSNITDPVRMAGNASAPLTAAEQFTMQVVGSGAEMVDPDDIIYLKSVGNGKFCRLAPLPKNASLTGLLCDQAASFQGTKLVYAGFNGLRLTNGSWLVVGGPDCAMAVSDTAGGSGGDGSGSVGGNCTANCSGGGLQPVIHAPSPPPPPAGPPLPPDEPLSLHGSCAGISAGRMAVGSTTEPLALTNATSPYPTTAQQFSLHNLDGSRSLIPAGAQVLLKSISTGRYCRLSPLPANTSLTGLLCDQSYASGAAVLLYSGVGLQLLNGTHITPSGPNCTYVADATSTDGTYAGGGGGGGGVGGGGSCSTGCTGGNGGFVDLPPAPPPAGPPLLPGDPTEILGSCGGRPGRLLAEGLTSPIRVGSSSPPTPIILAEKFEIYRADFSRTLIEPDDTVVIKSLGTGRWCRLAPLPPNTTLSALLCDQISSAGASVLVYTGTGFATQDGRRFAAAQPYGCVLVVGPAGSGGGSCWTTPCSPDDGSAQPIPLPGAPPPPPAGPTLPPGDAMELKGSCGGVAGRLTCGSPSDVVHMGSGTSSWPTPAEQFNMYQADGSDRMIAPDDLIRLKSLGTGMYCRLAPLPANATLTGLLCDQPRAAAGSVLLYTGRALALVNGSVLAASGPGCALVVTGTTGPGNNGGQCRQTDTCTDKDGGLAFDTLAMPPPPPAGPPVPPGQDLELLGSCAGRSDAHMLVSSLTDYLRVGDTAASTAPTPAELFELYCSDGSLRLVMPDDQILLKSVGNNKWCRLAPLYNNTVYTGLLCDTDRSGASVLVYTGRGFNLLNGTAITATGPNCTLVVNPQDAGGTGGGGSGGGGCVVQPCTGSEGDIGFKLPGAPPPAGPQPITPGDPFTLNTKNDSRIGVVNETDPCKMREWPD